MRTGTTVAILGAVTVIAACSPSTESPATDGKTHLAYELELTNVLSQDVTLTALTVLECSTARPPPYSRVSPHAMKTMSAHWFSM
jgi:hypothetical protein